MAYIRFGGLGFRDCQFLASGWCRLGLRIPSLGLGFRV